MAGQLLERNKLLDQGMELQTTVKNQLGVPMESGVDLMLATSRIELPNALWTRLSGVGINLASIVQWEKDRAAELKKDGATVFPLAVDLQTATPKQKVNALIASAWTYSLSPYSRVRLTGSEGKMAFAARMVLENHNGESQIQFARLARVVNGKLIIHPSVDPESDRPIDGLTVDTVLGGFVATNAVAPHSPSKLVTPDFNHTTDEMNRSLKDIKLAEALNPSLTAHEVDKLGMGEHGINLTTSKIEDFDAPESLIPILAEPLPRFDGFRPLPYVITLAISDIDQAELIQDRLVPLRVNRINKPKTSEQDAELDVVTAFSGIGYMVLGIRGKRDLMKENLDQVAELEIKH